MKRLMSTLSTKGQTTIPLEIREKLGVRAGDILQFSVEGDFVKIHKLEKVDMKWAKGLEDTLGEWGGSEDDDL